MVGEYKAAHTLLDFFYSACIRLLHPRYIELAAVVGLPEQ